MQFKRNLAPVLTLHQGGAQAAIAEHPTESARRALIAAAELEAREVAAAMRRVADALPQRGPIIERGA